jgi:hypothetical protein
VDWISYDGPIYWVRLATVPGGLGQSG